MGGIDQYPPGPALSSLLAWALIPNTTVSTTTTVVTAPTVTVPAGRTLRITGQGLLTQNTSTGNILGAINEDGNNIARWARFTGVTAAAVVQAEGFAISTPAAGSHTYTLDLSTSAGTITAGPFGNHNLIMVEDITGSVWPTGAPVTAGMVASEAWNTWTPTLTQSGTVTATVTYAHYVKIGRTVIGSVLLAVTGTGTSSQRILVTAPVTAAVPAHTPVGAGYLGAGATNTNGSVAMPDTTHFGIIGGSDYLGASGVTTALTSGNSVSMSFSYEAAS